MSTMRLSMILPLVRSTMMSLRSSVLYLFCRMASMSSSFRFTTLSVNRQIVTSDMLCRGCRSGANWLAVSLSPFIWRFIFYKAPLYYGITGRMGEGAEGGIEGRGAGLWMWGRMGGCFRVCFINNLKVIMFIMPKRAPSPASSLPYFMKGVLLLLLASLARGKSLSNQSAQLLLTAITPSNPTILATTTYTFSFSRYATAPLPLNSLLLLTFSNQYTSQGTSSPSCSATGITGATPSCSFSNSVLFVTQLFNSAAALSPSSFSLAVSNIINPTPAGDYSPITAITILAPNASVVESGSSGAVASIVGGSATCYSSVSNPYAFTDGQISVTYSSPYITSGSTNNYNIYVSVPTTYPDDPTATPINPECSLTKNPDIYPDSFLFQAGFASTFTISLKMPPSTKPETNFISIYTQTSKGVIGDVDSCSITINGIQPTTFSSMSISKGTVQTAATILFDLALSTPLFQTDTLTIAFPSTFTLSSVPTSVTVAGFGTLTLTRYDNNLLISSISSQAVLNPRLIFNISSVGMPFTTTPYTLSLTLGTTGNYSRIVQSYSYSAAPGALNVTVSCLNAEIGTTNTRCVFSLATVSTMTGNGSLNIMFPNEFPLASGSSPCPLSGIGLYSNINCLSTASSNTIQASSLSASSGNILPLALTLNVTVNMPQFVGNYSLTVYTMSLGATVDQGSVYLATIARVLKGSEFYVSSSSSMTNSATTYTAYFSLPFDLGVTYTVALTLPFAVQNGLSVSITGGTLVSFSGSLLTFTASQLTGNYSVSISNMLSPASLQPTTVSLQVIYSNTVQFSGSASVRMSQIKPFGTATVAQSNQVVYASAIATFALSDLQSNDRIVLTAYNGFYESIQTNCSSGVVTCGASGVLTVLNTSTTLTTFLVNMRNLGYVGQTQLNITTYDNTQTYAKQSSIVTLTATTPNVIAITANQTNPYLSEASIYTFALQFTTTNSTSLLVTPPAGLFVTAANCLLNCANATKLTIGYLFLVSSTNCVLTVSLINPSAFGSSVKFIFKTSGSQGDMDYGEYVPQAACAVPCRSCSTTSISNCLTCYSWSSQTILSNSTCVSVCPTGYFQTVSSSVEVCSPCNSLCTICLGSSSNCSGCQNGSFLFNSGCYQSCPLGSYITSSNICIACLQANCAVCNETTCTACLTGFSFFNFTCLATCPGGYYTNSGKCVSCAVTCLVCSPSDGSCSACLSPNLLYGGACYSSCPNGVYQQVSNNLCQACQPPCASCSLLSTNCTSCLHLFNSTNYYYLASRCYPATCPNGYFPDTAAANCVTCSLGCAVCSANGCSACNMGVFLYQGKCFGECPNGTYGNGSVCIGCSSICSNCLSGTTCTSCIMGYNLYDSACLLTCPQSYYANQTGNVCLRCNAPCRECNFLGCLNCLTGYYLQQNTCTPSCSGTYHPNNSTMVCEGCRAPCLGCTWSTSCTSCQATYSLLGENCLSSCPIGYYSNGGHCLSCPGNCTACSFLNNQPACTACLTGMLLFSFNCLSICPNGTQSSNGYCLSTDCSSLLHCLSCAGSECLHCTSLYQMDSEYSCSETVNGSAVAGALMSIPVPFPFLIAILMLVVVAFLLKHNFPKMFSPLFIYAVAGCFEFLSLALWTLLSVFWNIGMQEPLPYASVVYAPVLIGCVYVCLNVVQFILWSRRVQGDRQYRLWEKQDNRCASLSIAIVSLFFSFRLDALKFSKTAHDPHLSAHLSSPQVFRHYWVLALLSILLSAVSILASIYISYMQVSLNYLFFTGVEVAVIAIIMIVLSSAVLCVSRSQLLQDRSEYQVGYDQDQLDGKSVEELLNGLAVVEEHHEHHDYYESGNAVLMKNDYSSENYSQDLTLMQPVPTLSFHDKPESLEELNSQSRKQTVGAGEEEEGEARDEIFGATAEISSQDHILVDEFEHNRREAAELATHYGLAEQPLNSTYPRQTGAIVKQRLPELHEDSSEIQSVGSFQQFAVDMTRGKWRKQTPGGLPKEEEEQPQGEDIEELQIKQLIEARLREEDAQRRKEEQEKRKAAEEDRKREQLRRRVEQLKLQEIAREKERKLQQEMALQQQVQAQRRRQQEQRIRLQEQRMKQQEQKKKALEQQMRKQQEQRRRQEQEKRRSEQAKRRQEQEQKRRQEQQKRRQEQKKRMAQEQVNRKAQAQILQKKRVAEQRLKKIEMQKRRQQQWRQKKQQARLLKLQQERQLQERMQRLRRQQEELQRRLKEEEALEFARLQEERLQQLQFSRQELQKINRLKANLQKLQGMTQQYQDEHSHLQQEETQLQWRQQEKARENRERGLMAVEDRLSRMAIVFEDMWRKAAQLTHKPSRRIRNQEERQIKVPPKTINYHNADQNIVSELSPRKIKVAARPHPNQYTRRHLFVEQGTEILSDNSSSSEREEEELEIVFQGGEGQMTAETAVDKPKSILHHHRRPDKTKIDYLHYHDKDLKEVEDFNLKNAFIQSSTRHALSAAPHKEMPKEDTDEPITMVFQDNMEQVLEQQGEDEDKQSSQWSRPSKLSANPKEEPSPVDIEYVGRSIHSQSSDTHWPIEPQMHQRILEVERRADRYINEPKRKDNPLQPYLYDTPQDRIYEEEEGEDGEEGETQLGEIVFEESDQILEEESRATGFSRSAASSARRRYPTGRVNRMVIDLSPPR